MVDNNTNRRAVLVKAGSIGSIAAGVGLQTAIADGSQEDSVEIVTAKAGDEVLERVEVPRWWYTRIRTARRVQENMVQRFTDDSWFMGAGRRAPIEADNNENGQGNGSGERIDRNVVVYFDKNEAKRDDVEDQVPDEAEGINIRVEKSSEDIPQNCHTDDQPCDPDRDYSTFDCVPAGSSKTTDYADGSGRGSSSFGPPVEHDSDVCLLTDAHSFSEESGWSCVDIDGATAVHGDADHGDEYLFGEVRTHDWDYDTAVVEHNSSVVDGPDNRIFAHNDDEVDVDGKPIWGHVTEWGLDNMYDEAETAYQTERTTGQTSGRLLEVTYGRTRCDDEVDFVKSGACTQGGDSGGIHYRHNYNEHKERWEFQVIGVHSAFGCDLYYKGTEPYEQYYSVAAPAYALSSELGVSFTVDSC